MADTPLEVHWTTYRGLNPEIYGKQGWATVWNDGKDYIFYGDDKKMAVHQASISNQQAGFGGDVVIRYNDNASIQYNDNASIQYKEPLPISRESRKCFKLCPICWLLN